MSNLAAISISHVWAELGGQDLRRGRGRAFWRNGDGFNVSVDVVRGIWYDFATGKGGGVLALVETVLECGRPDALLWLEASGFIEPQRRLSRVELRQRVKRYQDAQLEAALASAWLVERLHQLDQAKRCANEAGDDTALVA